MKCIITLFTCILFAVTNAGAQQVLNTTGSTISTNNFVIEYAVGEIAITTISAPSNHVTQGLLQPNIKISNPDCAVINQPFQYFPSPTYDKLRLVGQNNWIDAYQVFAADGKLVRSVKFYNNEIDLSNLAAGIYFIRMLPGCDNRYKTIKIFKTTR
jgi:Secretion system C-terminal sorting domain